MSGNLLSILMPVYNERSTLSRIVELVLAAPLPGGLERELVMVDDGSTDGSSELMDRLAAAHPEQIRAFHQPANQGKGSAIARAVEEMRGDIALIQDADMEYDPADYARLLDPIVSGRADVVYGSRFQTGGSRRVINYHHELGNRLLTQLSNMTTGFNLSDMETCYKVFRADILRTIPIRSKRFGIEPELTAKIAKRACVVYEVPINYYGRTYAEGKKITWRDGLESLWIISKYWLIDDCWEERYGHSSLHALSRVRRITQWMVKEIEPFLGDNILEIGSGIGAISRQLPRRGRLTVSDGNEDFVRLLRQAFCNQEAVEVVKLDIERPQDVLALGRTFDTILCLDLLENLQDDAAAIRHMGSLLDPGGRIILEVPRNPRLMSALDRELGHLRRYQQGDLFAKLTAAGLEIELCKEFNFSGLLAWWLQGKVFKRSKLSHLQLKWFDSMAPIARLLESKLPLPGVSMLVIARRSSSA